MNKAKAKEHAVNYFQETYGFAPRKNELVINELSQTHCVFSLVGDVKRRKWSFDIAEVALNMKEMEETEENE